MPATDAQVAANRQNALLSRGPVTEAGQARSRLNATTHGLASSSVEVEAAISPEFQERRDQWAAEHNPIGEAANYALDRAVAATFRIARCERAIETHIARFRERARLAWEEDRAVEAATIAARLPRNPVLASRQLRSTLAGVGLMIEIWLGLASLLEAGDWSESAALKALDLLGVDPDFRSVRTPIDPLDGSDPVGFRRQVALAQVARLETLRDGSLVALDAMDREQAMDGDVGLLSKEAKLLLRYERDAWKHFREAMKEVEASSRQDAPPVVLSPPPRPVVGQPKPREQVVAPPARSFEEERRALLAEAAPYLKAAKDRLIAEGFEGEDAWFAELERQAAGGPLPRASYVNIAAGGRNSR